MKSFTGFGLLVVALLGSSALTACRNDGSDLSPSALSCTVSKSNALTTIHCPNGSNTLINDGATGPQGQGSGTFSTLIPAGDERCQQGNGGFAYTHFIDRNNDGIHNEGEAVVSTNTLCNGATGHAGVDGTSSSVSVSTDNAQSCPAGGWILSVINGTQAAVHYPLCNGTPGHDTAPPALSLIRFIAPCGMSSSAWKEQLIAFSDGSLMGTFSNTLAGDHTRLAFISDGGYIDTDDSGCTFSVSSSGGIRTVSWGPGASSAQPSGWSAGSVSW